MSIVLWQTEFGVTKDGEKADRFLMVNSNELCVEVSDFGALVLSICVPDSRSRSYHRGHKISVRKAAKLYGADSGITMEAFSDLCGLQVYTGNFLNGQKGKDGTVYERRSGVRFGMCFTFRTHEKKNKIDKNEWYSKCHSFLFCQKAETNLLGSRK